MTNLVTPPAGSELTNAQLATAEALVAAQLAMPLGLALRADVGESGEIGSSGLIHLTSPAVSIQSLVVAGAPVAGVLTGPRTVDVSTVVRPYLSGGLLGTTYARLPYLVTYTTGWTEESLPEGIYQAVLITAGQVAAAAGREAGVIEERMGPVSYRYSDTYRRGSVPADAVGLLQPWLPLRV